MKYFDTHGTQRQWDRFDAFYWKWNCFIKFETGELMLDVGASNADWRTMYTNMHIRLCATSNMSDKIYTPDGEPVTIASLERTGLQSLLIDYDHKMVVAVEEGYKVKEPRYKVNTNMANAGVFYMKENDPPQSQSFVEVGVPLRLDKAKLEWRKEVMEYAKPLYELQKDVILRTAFNKYYQYRKGVSPKPEDYSIDPTVWVSGLDLETLYFLNVNGLSTTYEWSHYDHLIIK